MTQFTYAIRPTIGLEDRGFDHVEISAKGGRLVSIDDVRIGGQQVAFERVAQGAERLVVGVPRLDVDRTEEVVEVDFSGEIFRYGATFAGRVFDSQTPQEIWQPVQPGDATALRDGNTLSVQALALGPRVLGALDLAGGIFTPNGDGVNDGLDIAYNLLKLVAPTPVVVQVRDVAGGLVREVYNGLDAAGRHRRQWDGLDGRGQRVAPGVYICRVEVATEEGRRQPRRGGSGRLLKPASSGDWAMVREKCTLALGLGLGLWGLVEAQNHALRSDYVVVNTQRHWSNWAFVEGTLDISASGEIAPAFVPKDHDAVTDIVQHLRRIAADPDNTTILDAIEAGSNKAAVANLFDGDETTYWEPDPDSPLRDWWFQVDMGRLINATRIGLQFAPAGQGDPFFAVRSVDGRQRRSGQQGGRQGAHALGVPHPQATTRTSANTSST